MPEWLTTAKRQYLITDTLWFQLVQTYVDLLIVIVWDAIAVSVGIGSITRTWSATYLRGHKRSHIQVLWKRYEAWDLFVKTTRLFETLFGVNYISVVNSIGNYSESISDMCKGDSQNTPWETIFGKYPPVRRSRTPPHLPPEARLQIFSVFRVFSGLIMIKNRI